MQQASSSMTVPGLFHSNEGGVQGQKTYVEQGRRVKIGAIVSEMEGIMRCMAEVRHGPKSDRHLFIQKH